jgi:predicted nucleotidyltransferase
MKYVLDRRAVSERMKALGYRNVSDFAAQTGIHRNTILGYYRGKSVFAAAFTKIARALGGDPLDLIVSTPAAHVSSPHVDEIRPIVSALLRRSPGIAVVLLGSRARGRPKSKFSDWDIGVIRPSEPLSADEFLALRGAAADLAENLVRGVDLINLDAAPAWFWEGVDYEPVFLDGNREAYAFLKGLLRGIKKNGQAA